MSSINTQVFENGKMKILVKSCSGNPLSRKKKKKKKQKYPNPIPSATHKSKYTELMVQQEAFPNVIYCFVISKKPQNTLSTFLQELDNRVSEDGLKDHDDGIYTLPG